MKRHKGFLKRSLAICLAMATVITTVYRPDRTAWAETSTIQPDTVTENEIQTEGTNSFGNLLNKELEEKLDEQKENAGYNVFSLEVTGTTVNVELEALEACTLVVGIYDEAGTTMLGSGTADVPEKAEGATVTVDIASMPTYFDVKAYLIDSETQAPLCQVFDCPTYTQEMQEFLKKSVNDFDADRVLNLDDSEDNNFAVFQEDVKYIEEQENANQVTTEDEANNTYVIENASAEIQALQPGDTTALEYTAGQVLIIKVASITLDGTTATIVGEDTSLEEVFEYMKIDTESYTGDATVDTSNLEEGITYRGMSASEEVQAQTVAAEDEMTADQAGSADKEGITLKYDIDCSLSSEHNEVKVSGSVEINVKVNLNLCITPTKQYFEFCIDYKLQTNIGVTGKIKFVFPLGKMEFSPVAGVYIRITPKVEEEFSGSLTLTATLTGRVGASITVGAAAVNLSKSPTLNTSLRIEGRAYIGVVFEPEIVLVCDQLLRAGVAFRVGAALTLKSDLLEASSGVIHGCKECLSGDISVIISATFELCFLNMDSLTVKKTFETRIKLADCHFSLDYDEFQLCPCPRKGYLAKLKVIDKNEKAVPNATITGKFLTKENGVVKQISSVTTDAKGKVNVYMPYGKQTIQVKSNGKVMAQTINKLDKQEKVTIKLMVVPLNSTVFPDATFRQYVSDNFDENKDGILSEAEIAKVERIAVKECGVTSLDGIEVFYALKILNCRDNQLSELDVSKNVALEDLDCRNNRLSELDVSKNTALQELYCHNNQLSELEVSKNTALQELWCYDNQLSELDVSKNTALGMLRCGDTQLSELEVSKNTALRVLWCEDTQLSELDVSKNTALRELYCYNTQLSELDVSKNTKLQILCCDSNVKLTGWPRTTKSSNTANSDAVTAESISDLTPEFPGQSGDISDSVKYDQDLEAELASEEETASESEPLTSPVTYTDLLPNSIYNFYVLKDKEEAISSDNLLYIIQITSDENGQATIPFAYNQSCNSPQAKLVGMEKLDIAGAEVTIEDLYYTGEAQDAEPAVVYKGTALEPGKDYTITGDYQATEIGTYTIQIVGTGLYKGSLEKSYQILPITVAEIKLSQSTLSMKKGETAALTVTITPENATDKSVDWISSDTKIATVDSTGKVTAVSAGTASITCTAKDGSDKKATCEVTVTDPTPPKPSVVKVVKITLNKTTASVGKGKTMQLTATVTPTNATNKAVTWKSSNTKIATVSSTGKVTAKSAGTVTITCTAKDGSGKKATCKVTVTEPKPPVKPTVKVTKLTLNKKAATLSPKETLTLRATVTPTNATNKAVTWKSSNTKIATVSSTGKVTAKSAGTVTITCTAKDGSGKKATCRITVYNNTQAYVARIYTKALGRAAEPAGLNYWVGEINAKRRTPVQVAEEFFFAPEFVNKKLSNTEYVKVLYRTFMGREYDKGGLDYWVGRLNKGESRKSVLEAFAGCPEFRKIVKSFGL